MGVPNLSPRKDCSGKWITLTKPMRAAADRPALRACASTAARKMYEEILDWRPFDYFTERISLGSRTSALLTANCASVKTRRRW